MRCIDLCDDTELKTIAYSYMFNYFGGAIYNNERIMGATIDIAILPYDVSGNLVKFNSDPKVGDFCFSDIFELRFDRDKLFLISRNLLADMLFCKHYGWSKIDYKIVHYSLDKYCGKARDEMDGCPDAFLDFPVIEPMFVSESEFRGFMSEHLDDFDISDNRIAQVPGVLYI